MELEDFSKVLEESKKVLQDCFEKFQLNEVFLSFNGGKDCTVLLDITLDILKDIYNCDNIETELKVVYIRTIGPFKEIEVFVREVEKYYDIKLKVMEGEMKTTLQTILEQDDQLKACLLGTRRTDPYSKDLKFMQKTDPNWPQVVRVSPLLNWSYHQIWSYILQRKLPYCSLYERGYTSIGSVHNTLPNPSLAYKDINGTSYRPAWMLQDSELERAGRNTTLNSINNNNKL